MQTQELGLEGAPWSPHAVFLNLSAEVTCSAVPALQPSVVRARLSLAAFSVFSLKILTFLGVSICFILLQGWGLDTGLCSCYTRAPCFYFAMLLAHI